MSLFTSGCKNWYKDDLKDPIIMLIEIIEGNDKALCVYYKKENVLESLNYYWLFFKDIFYQPQFLLKRAYCMQDGC